MQHQQKPTGGRGLISLRVSGPRQDLEEQRNIIQAWLDTWGLAGNVVEWFMDTGSRLEAYKREGFQALLKWVTQGDIDWVAVECLDRFGVRSGAELGKFICHLQDNNVRLFAISAGLELTSDDAYTQVVATVGGLRSTDDLRSRAHRALKGRAKAFRQGRFSGGPVPYGFDKACLDLMGVELWRIVMLGPHNGVQVFPDGRRVEFSGKDSRPTKTKQQRFELVPSLGPKEASPAPPS
jgi:DNA invertase Pin-like site-specific DNA recombinase